MKLYENQIPPWVFSSQFWKHFWNRLYLEHPQALAYALILIKLLFSTKSMYSIVFPQTFCNTRVSFSSFIKNVFLHRCELWNFLNFAKFLEDFGQVQCIEFPGCELKDTVGFSFASLNKTTWYCLHVLAAHLHLAFVSITEATSNVESITEMVCESFSNTNLALVQSNCLRYEDSEGTRGEKPFSN